MCGIFGFTFFSDEKELLLEKMGLLQAHRGPDGKGSYVDNNIAMGMRRLSIIDVEHGNQPFSNRTGSVVVICNGEIYNHCELRAELQGKGYSFATRSDVEVLPHLYEEYGIDFIHKLNGMYAIALYDATAGKLILIRDRIGIKPLYFALHDNELMFSSELKSILGLNVIQKDLSFEALSSYLDLMYIPRPMTPFKNVFKLESGSYLLWENNKHSIASYWNPELNIRNDLNEQGWMQRINDVLDDSIRLELRSDVPVGSFLSGGVDSSLVTALAANASPQAFSTFHMRWKDVEGKIDESVYAKMVSDRYATQDISRDIGDIDIIGLLPKLVWHMEEPFADAAFVPTYILSCIAAKNVKVILSGAGGDELFGGYPHHGRYSLVRSFANKILFGKNPAASYYDIWKSPYSRRWPDLFPWFAPDTSKERFDALYRNTRGIDYSNSIMISDIAHYMQDDILFLTDKMTMAASIECRVPLLDHRLVELSLEIPSRFKLRGEEHKYILKKFSEDYLPKEVLYRKKEGFGCPVWFWISRYKDLYFNIILEDGYLLRNGLVQKKQLHTLLFATNMNKRTYWVYWQVLILEIWCRLFMGGYDIEQIFEPGE